MRMVDLIEKKRDGLELSKEEIDFIIEGYTEGSIPDYQMSAFAMAVYFSGMNDIESTNLAIAMLNSGDAMDLSMIDGVKVDKHSTGGVGDKVSLVGFGTFEVKTRAARAGKNPRTGEAITIPASKYPAFSAGGAMKASVNK